MQLFQLDGFDKLTIEAGLLRPGEIVIVGVAGDGHQHCTGRFRQLAKLAGNLVAIEPRQQDVQQDNLGPEGACRRQGHGTIVRHLDIMSPDAQKNGEAVNRILAVIDDEDAHKLFPRTWQRQDWPLLYYRKAVSGLPGILGEKPRESLTRARGRCLHLRPSSIMAAMHICLFDIDGTLLNSGGAGKAAMESALATEFGLGRVQQGVPYSGRTDRAIGHELLRIHGIEPTPANWRRLQRAYLGNLPSCLGRHNGKVLPGIAALLGRLRNHDGAAVGLLTGNIRAGAEAKLGYFGLFHHFQFGGFGDEHLERDDVAREALAAAHAFCGRVACERIWVIGDTPLDVRCARAIGARVAAVATGVHSLAELEAEQPDLLLADLSDAAPLLAKWS